MNRSDPNIDELLNSFIDGELTQKQQMEVRRLIADDEQIACRLRDLQKCKMLVECLPHAQVPAETLEQIKASLQDRTLAQQTVLSQKRRKARRFSDRRVLAVAATVALMAALAALIYSTFAPERAADSFTRISPTPAIAAATGLGGRLELRTTTLNQVDAFINRAIKDDGLSDCVRSTSLADRRVYSFSCSRHAVALLLADLAGIWGKFTSAALIVETPKFGAQIVIDAVTAAQIAEIVKQEDQERAVRMARDFAILNNMAELLPGKEMLAAAGEKKPSLITVPKPLLTGEDGTVEKPATPDAGRADPSAALRACPEPVEGTRAELTIVLIGSK